MALSQAVHWLMPGFQNQDEDQDQVHDDQKVDASHGPVALLALFSLSELLVRFRALMYHLLDVVVDAVQHGALVYDQHSQLLEDRV